MKRSIILIILLLVFIVGIDSSVEADSFTQNMTVSIFARDNYRQRTQGGSCPLSVKLDATTESRGNKTVKYMVINYHDEQAICDWINVTEGGSRVYGEFLDSWGRDECNVGDEIFVRWKNGTNFYWSTYTVYGTVWFY